MYEKYLDILSKTPLFYNMDKKEINKLLNCIKPKIISYSKYSYITVAGFDFKSIGILLKGEATVSKEDAAGNRIVMTVLKQGDIFGEIIVFSTHSKWPATVQAQEYCEVLFLEREKIVGECGNVCSWHRKLIQNMLTVISEKALLLNKKVDFLTIKSIRGKISTYLLEQFKKTGNNHIKLPLNRNELADFLNVSRPSLSREMCKMRDEGIIDFYLSTVKILDVDELKAASQE